MNNITSKLQEVNDSFQNGDRQLAMRRLTDCVIDTSDKDMYKSLLSLIEEQEINGQENISSEKLQGMLESLSAFPYTEGRVNSSIPLMEVKSLGKAYRNSRFTLSGISFTLRHGEVVGLVGENGNGKTSLLRLLCKDLEPDSGTVSYSASSGSSDLFTLRSRLVYIPQRVPRWFGSLMDNLRFTLSTHGIRGEENSLRTELIIARLGLRPYRHLSWNRISSGYRTRFELAKSLLRKPELMLLDEPLSNLDIISQQTILQDLKFMSESLQHPFGLVLSSQQLYEVEKISDLVVFLKQGKPQYQSRNRNNESMKEALILEMEADESREILSRAFSKLGLQQIHFNGGVYILHFAPETSLKEIYTEIGNLDLAVNYIRNISYSSRRFFIQ